MGAIGWSSRVPGALGAFAVDRALRAPLPDYIAHLPVPFGGPRARATVDSNIPAPGPQGSYLVDSASSHMLVSKIKPCMSKCKQFIL